MAKLQKFNAFLKKEEKTIEFYRSFAVPGFLPPSRDRHPLISRV